MAMLWRRGAILAIALLCISILPAASSAKPDHKHHKDVSPVRPSEEDSPTWNAMKWATSQFVMGGLAEAIALGVYMPLNTLSIAAQNEGVLNKILRTTILVDKHGRPIKGQPSVPALLPPLKMAERLYWRYEHIVPAYSTSFGLIVLFANALKSTALPSKLSANPETQHALVYGLAAALTSVFIFPADFSLRKPRGHIESTNTFLGAVKWVALREAPVQAALGAALAISGCHEGRCSFQLKMMGVLWGSLAGLCTAPADVLLSQFLREDTEHVGEKRQGWLPPMPRFNIKGFIFRGLAVGLRALVLPAAMRFIGRFVFGLQGKGRGLHYDDDIRFEKRHVREAGKVTERVASSEDVSDDELVLFDLPWDDDHDVNLLEDGANYNDKVKNKYVDPTILKKRGWRRQG